MKKLVVLIIVLAGAAYVYVNRDSLVGKTGSQDYAMKGYKQSLDKAHQVEQELQKSKAQLDQAVEKNQ